MSRLCFFRLALIVVVSTLLVSCSSGPQAPKIGSPLFYWQAAQTTYAAGDYLKTVGDLDHIVASDNEYTARAHPLRLVLLCGLTKGYMDLADAYESGGRANRVNFRFYQTELSKDRAQASQLALQLVDAYQDWQKSGKSGAVTMGFPLPAGSVEQHPLWKTMKDGAAMRESDFAAVNKYAIEREVLLAFCRVAAPRRPRQGAGDSEVASRRSQTRRFPGRDGNSAL